LLTPAADLIAILPADRAEPQTILPAEGMLRQGKEDLLPQPLLQIQYLSLIFLLLYPLFEKGFIPTFPLAEGKGRGDVGTKGSLDGEIKGVAYGG
jgi:hypothetical protein